MKGISIVETKTLQILISRIEILENKVVGALNQNSKPYLTTKDVCEMLNKSENWVLLHKHDLGCSKRTGTLLFKRKDVEDYIEEGYYKSKNR